MSFTTLQTPGKKAIAQLEQLRDQFQQTGEYPFLVGDSDEVEQLQEQGEDRELAVEEILKQSESITIRKWIAQRKKEYEFDLDELEGEWPDEEYPPGEISLHRDVLSRKVKPEVFLGLAKIAEPWHLPAVLNLGGWNECPDAIVQCAFFRQWQENYGAEIASVSGDIVECIVKNPPKTQEAALELAWEQYWFCADIIEQGCESVSVLAATLINSPYWYFWWD
jgi:hypothetical protein